MADVFCPRSITFTIPGVPGVQVTAVQNGGVIDFTVDVIDSSSLTGDLRGLFFQFNDAKLDTDLKVTDTTGYVTKSVIGNNNVIDLGNGDNMNGAASPFDVGIEFGAAGITKDDISFPVQFTLSNANNDLTLDDFAHLQFGARVTSIGVPGGDRPPSSSEKIVAVAPAAPHAVDDTFNIFEDGAKDLNSPSKTPAQVKLDVLSNDKDADGDQLTVTGFHDGPSHGTVAISADGQVLYTPSLDYAGSDSFVYCVSDGHGGQDNATVNVSIAAVADEPTIDVQVLPGADAYHAVLKVTATQNDADSSEFIDRIDATVAGGLPPGVTVTPLGGINPGDEPDQIIQDFAVALPPRQDTKFDLTFTAVSQETSNGDQQVASKVVPIELHFNHNSATETFDSGNQSIWGIDLPPVNLDKFVGVDQPIDVHENPFPVPIPVPPFIVPIDVNADGLFKAGLQVGVHLNAGEIDATLPFDITIDTAYNKTTHALLISSSETLDPSAHFDTTGPEGSVVLKALVDAFLNLNVDVPLDFTDLTDINVSLPHIDQSRDIFTFNSTDAATTVPLPFPGTTLNLAWPHISTHGVPTGSNTLFDSEPSNNVLTLDMDVDTMAISYFPLLAPIDPNPLDPNNPELFDTHINGGVNFVQAFTLLTGLAGELYFEDGSHRPFSFGQDLPIDDASSLDANGDGHIDCSLVLTPNANLTNKTDVGFNVGFSFDLFHNIPVIDSLVPAIRGTLPIGQINIFDNNFDLALNNQNYGFSA
jgi:hypothetical protein